MVFFSYDSIIFILPPPYQLFSYTCRLINGEHSGTSAAFSADGGFTWTNSVSGANQKRSSLASSSDGMKLAGT